MAFSFSCEDCGRIVREDSFCPKHPDAWIRADKVSDIDAMQSCPSVNRPSGTTTDAMPSVFVHVEVEIPTQAYFWGVGGGADAWICRWYRRRMMAGNQQEQFGVRLFDDGSADVVWDDARLSPPGDPESSSYRCDATTWDSIVDKARAVRAEQEEADRKEQAEIKAYYELYGQTS
jgi:hypothetical protein